MSASTFTDREILVLTAICDTLAPSLDITADPGGLYARPSSAIGTPAAVAEAIATVADPGSRFLTRITLRLFDHPLMNWLLGGPFASFVDMPADTQTSVLRRWAESRLEPRRRAFQGFKRLALFFYYTLVDESGCNPNWPSISYPGPQPAPAESNKPIKPLIVATDTTLYTDVVIVGSGAGGGVVAGELTAAGLDVIVLEKGGYHAERDFHGRELASTQRMFENQGLLTSKDLGVVILAGSTLGGGTTINWCASFRTPQNVLEEWEHDYGVKGFTGEDYQRALDAVSARINVNQNESIPNPQNAAMERGSQALGYTAAVIPRNVQGCQDCGFCNYGCRYGAKQSTLVTYLQDAHQHGARIIVNTDVDRVIINRGQATGVQATVTTDEGNQVALTIKAKTVVVSAGALHTPALLMRSGLTNAHIGRNLHLHPTSPILGEYDSQVQGWSGVIMSRYVTNFRNLDGKGYGVVLETASVHPGIAALALPWESGLQHKATMSRIATIANMIIITRDRDSGHISLNDRGRPVINYSLSNYDAKHLMRGIIEALRIQIAADAHEVSTPQTIPNVYRSADGKSLDDYLASVEASGLHKNGFALLSAHQMSSCRMGANPSRGAIAPTGETFEVGNLFVADASALPTATGTNPMLTIMGVSHVIAQHIKAKFGK